MSLSIFRDIPLVCWYNFGTAKTDLGGSREKSYTMCSSCSSMKLSHHPHTHIVQIYNC